VAPGGEIAGRTGPARTGAGGETRLGKARLDGWTGKVRHVTPMGETVIARR